MLNVEEFSFTDTDTPLAGIPVAQESVAFNQGRAHWGKAPVTRSQGANGGRSRPPAGWTPEARAMVRMITDRFGVNTPIYQEEIVGFLMSFASHDGPLFRTEQQAANKVQDFLAAPWYPVVRVDSETTRSSSVMIVGTIMSESEVKVMGKLRSRDLASDPRNLSKVDL